MDFRILGSLEVESGGRLLHLGGPRQRALLAYLLLHANTPVSPDRLLDELWFSPPHGGLAALQTQVSRVRKIVGTRLVTSDGGYALHVDDSELDLLRLRGMLAGAGSAATPGERSRLLREADALWCGEPLAGLDAPFAAAEAAALDELRMGALEERLAADLECGLHAELIPEVSLLVSRYPLRERLRAQLILALYRAGRQADALEEYRAARRMLLDELGLEPSPALRELEQAILTQDESLAAPASPRVQAISELPLRSRWSRRRRLALVGIGSALLVATGSVAAVLSMDNDPSAAPVVHRSHPATAPRTKQKRKVAQPARKTRAPKAPRRAAKTVIRHRVQPVRLSVHHTSVRPAAVTPKTITSAPRATKETTKPATPAVRQPPTTLSDDFGEITPNSIIWNIGTDGSGPAPSWALQNGRLEMTLPASSAPGGRYAMVNVGFSTQCRFNADFDARVDYQVLDWPAEAGVWLQLAAWIFPALNSGASVSNNQYGENYNGNVGTFWHNEPTTDQQGAFRIARQNGVMSAYVLEGGTWSKLESGTAAGQVTLGLQLFAPGNDWAHKDVRAAFDNFHVIGTNVSCP